MKNIEFRKCTLDDLVKLREISIATFVTTFSQQNTAEDMKIYTTDAFSLAKVKEELMNKQSIFYFVLSNKTLLGYLKLNIEAAQSEPVDNGLEIERIYLLADYQKKGIGQIMMDKAFEVAKKLQKPKVWLGVWEKNYGAIRFYQRNGFKKFTAHDFYLGKDLQTDWLMETNL